MQHDVQMTELLKRISYLDPLSRTDQAMLLGSPGTENYRTVRAGSLITERQNPNTPENNCNIQSGTCSQKYPSKFRPYDVFCFQLTLRLEFNIGQN